MMLDWPYFRLLVFIGLLLVFSAAELLWPRRKQVLKWVRLKQNISLQLLSFLVLFALRLLLPLSLLALAGFLEQQSWGLFSLLPAAGLNIGGWSVIILALLLLDCGIYWQHRLMHTAPFLWRWHRVHHSDVELDASSALRFHPIEILISYLYKMLLISLLGAPVLAVFVFEVLLSSAALFNHSNIALPASLDRQLRRFWVTPDMHRIHHSLQYAEQQSNFSSSFSVWDYCFGSYCAEPQAGQLGMQLGEKQSLQEAQHHSWWWPILLPFKNNRREPDIE